MKKLIICLLILSLLTTACYADDYDMETDAGEVEASVFLEDTPVLSADDISVSAPSAILIEKKTGTVIYEKNADEKLEPASVTKVMTILLIAEAIDSGLISFDDKVTTSAYAASMGGSQVFLKEGEEMSVEEMLKCIVVSSANDCAVAMAEFISGSEQSFVAKMNARAAELGMVNSNFNNCTGLFDDPLHVTTARDLAIASRELISHERIKEYTTIWTDTIRNGEFGLSNTNKLIRYYTGATGLKTGFTSRAGHCLSATAERDGVEYITVVLNCPSSPERFESAKVLLSYAFANYDLISSSPDSVLPPVKVTLGKTGYVQPILSDDGYLLVEKSGSSDIVKKVELTENMKAPVKAGDKMGTLIITTADGIVLSETDIVAADDVARLSVWDIFSSMVKTFFFGS